MDWNVNEHYALNFPPISLANAASSVFSLPFVLFLLVTSFLLGPGAQKDTSIRKMESESYSQSISSASPFYRFYVHVFDDCKWTPINNFGLTQCSLWSLVLSVGVPGPA